MNEVISQYWEMTIEKQRFYTNKFQLIALESSRIIYSNKTRFCIELKIRDGAYTILVDWSFQELPRIYVLHPKIEMRDWIYIHTYNLVFNDIYKRELPLLCLWYPKDSEWTSKISLLDSFIPWAIEWTEFYELWLLSGKWYGREKHPMPNMEKKSV